MNTVGISLADNGITACLYDGEDTALIPLESGSIFSPGYAYLGDRGLILGEEAIRNFRLSPTRITDRFWDLLSLEPSALRARKKTISHAHLAYLHLKMVWERIQTVQEEGIKSVGLALPGHFLSTDPEEEERLGILLGIVADLGIPLATLLPLELAGFHYHLPQAFEEADIIYQLDVHQYQTHLYRLHGENELRSRQVGKIPDCGFHPIVETLHAKLAQRFLGETAFDISEDTEVEQVFFEKVRTLLHAQKKEVREISIPFDNQARSIQVAEDLLERLLAPFTSRISELVFRSLRQEIGTGESQQVALQLSGRAATIPGLANHLRRHAPLPLLVGASEKGAAAAGAAVVADRFPPAPDLQHTPIFSSWKRPHGKRKSARENGSEPAQKPTHLLYRSVAYPIPQSGMVEDSNSNGHALPAEVARAFQFPWTNDTVKVRPSGDVSLTINERPASGEFVLKTGDILTASFDGKRYQLECIFCPANNL